MSEQSDIILLSNPESTNPIVRDWEVLNKQAQVIGRKPNQKKGRSQTAIDADLKRNTFILPHLAKAAGFPSARELEEHMRDVAIKRSEYNRQRVIASEDIFYYDLKDGGGDLREHESVSYQNPSGWKESAKYQAVTSFKVGGFFFRFGFVKYPAQTNEIQTRGAFVMLDRRVTDFLQSVQSTALIRHIKSVATLASHDFTGHDVIDGFLQYPDINSLFEGLVDMKNGEVAPSIKRFTPTNYEVLVAKVHRMAWDELFKKSPKVKTAILNHAREFTQAVEELANLDTSKPTEFMTGVKKYLLSIYFKNLYFVINPQDPAFKELQTKYPYLKKNIDFMKAVHDSNTITTSEDGRTGVVKPVEVIIQDFANMVEMAPSPNATPDS